MEDPTAGSNSPLRLSSAAGRSAAAPSGNDGSGQAEEEPHRGTPPSENNGGEGTRGVLWMPDEREVLCRGMASASMEVTLKRQSITNMAALNSIARSAAQRATIAFRSTTMATYLSQGRLWWQREMRRRLQEDTNSQATANVIMPDAQEEAHMQDQLDVAAAAMAAAFPPCRRGAARGGRRSGMRAGNRGRGRESGRGGRCARAHVNGRGSGLVHARCRGN